MTAITVPLSVRLSSPGRFIERHITNDVADLTFRLVAPGGMASAQVSLARSLRLSPKELSVYSRLIIADQRNGVTVWEGRLEDPSRTAGDAGETWSLSAVGGMAHGSDQRVPLILVDTDMNGMVRSYASIAAGTVEASERSTDVTGLKLQIPNGTALNITTDRVVVAYRKLAYTGQQLARFGTTHDGGITPAANWFRRFYIRTGISGSGVTAYQAGLSTTTLVNGVVIVTDFPGGSNVPEVWLYWTGGTVTNTTDNMWLTLTNMYVRSTLFTQSGTERGNASNYTSARAGTAEIVADILGRGFVPDWDGPTATVTPGNFNVDQMAYPDGVTATEILDQLMTLELGFFYYVGARNELSDRHQFWWGPWPTDVRYEATTDAGYNAESSAVDLFNKVIVAYRNKYGIRSTYTLTRTVAELDNAGLTRCEFIDLGDDVASAAHAAQTATVFLAEHQRLNNAGTLTIAGKTRDLISGRMLEPYELKPGNLIRIEGIAPRVDALNPTDKDSTSTFRVVGVDYMAASNTAGLTLDAFPRDVTVAMRNRFARAAARRG